MKYLPPRNYQRYEQVLCSLPISRADVEHELTFGLDHVVGADQLIPACKESAGAIPAAVSHLVRA